MEENKNIETEQLENQKEIKEENIVNEVEEPVIDEEFADIDRESMKKNYIIVGILYLVVIILSVLLVLGIKNQQDTIKDKIDDNKETVEKNEETKDEEVIIPEEEAKEENKTNENKQEENMDDELNILDQI